MLPVGTVVETYSRFIGNVAAWMPQSESGVAVTMLPPPWGDSSYRFVRICDITVKTRISHPLVGCKE